MTGSKSSQPPGLMSMKRTVTLLTSILIGVSAGTNYMFSAYAPQLGSRLQINHTYLNIIGLAANMGTYGTGPLWGRLVDRRGPRTLFIGAFLTLLIGYSGIRHFYVTGIPSRHPLDSNTTTAPSYSSGSGISDQTLAILVFCSFLTGIGANAGFTGAMNSTAKSFPDSSRATTTGLVLSGFGLSAFFFAFLGRTFFAGDTSALLLLLALGTSVPMLLGLLVVRPVPLPHAHTHAHADEAPEEYAEPDVSLDGEQSLLVPGASLYAHANDSHDSHTPLISHHPSNADLPASDSDLDLPSSAGPGTYIHHDSVPSNYIVPRTPSAVELTPRSPSRARVSRSRSRVPRSASPTRAKLGVHDGPEVNGLALFASIDFWLLFVILSLLSGTGLMYINNVGSISQALYAKGDPTFDEVASSQWQAAQVSSISVANCLGRVVFGLVSDFTKKRLRLPRTCCISLVASLFVLSQLVGFYIEDVKHLWQASALLGLAYGGLFGLYPTVCIEWFGLAHFSENWGILSVAPLFGGNLFSLAFGRNLDAHEPPVTSPTAQLVVRGGLPSTGRQCLDGRDCYDSSLKMTIFACTLALFLSLWEAWRARHRHSVPMA